jgi:hypothetical protein
MPQQGQCGRSRSLAIYGLLLELYPRTYLRRHREEMLQNFQDLERELPSRAALCCFIAKDLAVSLRSDVTRSFWAQTTMAFTVLSLIVAIAHRHPGRQEPYIWDFCFGYAPGWFAGWSGWNWRMSSSSRLPIFVRSFRGQAAMLLCVITIVLVAASIFPYFQKGHAIASCYGPRQRGSPDGARISNACDYEAGLGCSPQRPAPSRLNYEDLAAGSIERTRSSA